LSGKKSPIEHIIVLMMENRSYDHMLGYLPNSHKLTGKEFNYVDPANPKSEKVYVSNKSGYVTATNPAHDVIGIEKQLYGNVGKIVSPAPMNGFVKVQIETAKGDVDEGKKIMECFDPAKIPALTTLAKEFILCDHWHSSVPGPTWLNRFFVHAATCDGVSFDDAKHIFKMKTIFDSLFDHEITWNVYYGDFPQSIILQHGGDNLGHFKRFHRYFEDLEDGKLAAYTFIEPRFLSFYKMKATDQHPPHDVRLGEYLIAEVYDALRASKYWEKSFLVILYDEHGGFFDRVPPPDHVPSPDGKVAVNPPFDFTRLGVRVPAILISPWVDKGKIDSTLYEHASLPATIRNIFGLRDSLTVRDKAANTFEKNLNRKSPRSDTPLKLPVPGTPDEIRRHRRLIRASPFEQWLRGLNSFGEKSKEPLTLYQKSLVEMADKINEETKTGIPPRASQIQREHEAAHHVNMTLVKYLKQKNAKK
jgi:phospholipase C